MELSTEPSTGHKEIVLKVTHHPNVVHVSNSSCSDPTELIFRAVCYSSTIKKCHRNLKLFHVRILVCRYQCEIVSDFADFPIQQLTVCAE